MPTPRQIEAAKIYARKIGEMRGSGKPVTMNNVLKEAGYSKHTQDNPKEVLESKGWNDLLEQYLPDSKILSKISENIEHRSVFGSNQALDMAIKLKGKYAPKKVLFEDPLESKTDEELDQMEKDLKEQRLRKIAILEGETDQTISSEATTIAPDATK